VREAPQRFSFARKESPGDNHGDGEGEPECEAFESPEVTEQGGGGKRRKENGN
jgi:hypothetical protein